MPEILSDPMSELPRKTVKYAQLCTELNLAHKNISVLNGFELFVNLESLWLNNNNLREIAGLENNFRLKYLYLHENRIKSISDSLQYFPFLNTLTLNNNELDNVDEAIEELKCLRHLQYLDLQNNPIAEEDNYRLRVIGELPWLSSLDRHEISNQEKSAAKLFKKRYAMRQRIPISTKIRLTKSEREAEEIKNKKLKEIFKKIKRIVTVTRSILENSFLEFDRRNLGYVTENQFLSVLRIYGIYNQLTEEEIELLLSKYNNLCDIDAIIPTGTISKRMVSYIPFCDEVIPNDLKVITRPWELEPVSELSATTTDLKVFVQSVKQKRKQKEEEEKRRLILASQMSKTFFLQSDTGESSTSTLLQPNHNKFNNGLDAWLTAELLKILNRARTSQPGVNATDIDKEQFHWILDEMKTLGKVPELNVLTMEDMLFDSGAETVSLQELCYVLGCEVPKKGKSIPVTSNGAENTSNVSLRKQSVRDRKESLKEIAPPQDNAASAQLQQKIQLLKRATTQSIRKKMKPITWRSLTASEAEEMGGILYRDANESMERILRAGKKDDVTDWTKSAISAATTATRLSTLIPTKSTAESTDYPERVIAMAPNRSDVIVLPGLRSEMLRQTVQKEGGGSAADWTRSMSSLGLRGDALQLAVDRKLRSQSSQLISRNNTLGRSNMNSNNGSTTSLPGVRDQSLKKNTRWTQSTGTLVI